MDHEYVLELKGITKIFPGVIALDDVNLQLKKGEVLALVGENGAGKSTLINCITGVYPPEKGEIFVKGEKVRMDSPMTATHHGISVVHQERNLIPTFDIAENIFFEEICEGTFGKVDRKGMHERSREFLKQVRLDLDPASPVDELSSAQKQLIEIARALSNKSEILLLDEPTASISVREADMLLEIVDDLRKQGVAIIYVSHKLEEIFAIADRIAVIRDGKSIGDATPASELDRDSLIERMVGNREIKHVYEKREIAEEYVLEAKEVATKTTPIPASFKLKKQEILGWYGLVGAGRTELAHEIIGIDPVKEGQIILNGKPVKIRSYKEAFEKYNIYYLSENRKEEGLFLIHSVANNISIVSLKSIKNAARLNSKAKEAALAAEYRDRVQIKMGDPSNPVSSLSGGNQQKVCIARCLLTEPEIIIADEPTVGIDVKTKAEIYKMLHDFTDQGKSVIMISSDLAELIQVVDRILVFRDGKIVGELDNNKDYDSMSAAIMDNILG